jgi:hypothetical protein
MCASSTRSRGNNTPKWPFPDVNDFVDFSQRQRPRRDTVVPFDAIPCFFFTAFTRRLGSENKAVLRV